LIWAVNQELKQWCKCWTFLSSSSFFKCRYCAKKICLTKVLW
jgi:hypothetical protein